MSFLWTLGKVFDKKAPHNGFLYKLFKSAWRWWHYISVVEKFSWEKKTKFSSRRRTFASNNIRCTSRISAGPLMFLIFINDLLCYVTSRVRLFTVDTVIYLTIKSDSDCRQLQDDLHSLEKWESDWCMEFNPSKCNVIRVSRRSKPFKLQYKLYGKVLETVDTTKCLGINLSNDLCWNDHVKLPPKQTRLWTFYATISALVCPNPKNEHTNPLRDRLLHTVPLSGTLTWLRTYNKSKWFNAAQLAGYQEATTD